MAVQSFVHVANVLFLVMYLVRDILWLRVVAVLAGLALYPYYLWGTGTPLWEPIAWNTVFNLINLVQLKRLVMERRPVRLNQRERDLYEAVFTRLSPREFLRLYGAARQDSAAAGACLVAQDSELDRLLLIRDGEVAVRVGEREVARLDPGRFVGEMSFLTRDRTSASVWAATATEYLSWTRAELERLFDRHPSIRTSVQVILGADLANKLKPKSAVYKSAQQRKPVE